MENTRPTKEITLVSGAVIVANTYITGREKRAINEVMLRSAEMRQTGSKSEITGVKGDVTFEMENVAIQSVVVEVRTGSETITDKKKVLDFVLDLPEQEYNAVIELINDVTNPKVEPTS